MTDCQRGKPLPELNDQWRERLPPTHRHRNRFIPMTEISDMIGLKPVQVRRLRQNQRNSPPADQYLPNALPEPLSSDVTGSNLILWDILDIYEWAVAVGRMDRETGATRRLYNGQT